MSPEVGSSKRRMTLPRVDLPHPLSPTNPKRVSKKFILDKALEIV
jgi:hypothetical protein